MIKDLVNDINNLAKNRKKIFIKQKDKTNILVNYMVMYTDDNREDYENISMLLDNGEHLNITTNNFDYSIFDSLIEVLV